MLILGMDEVGRGAIAGDITAAGFLLDTKDYSTFYNLKLESNNGRRNRFLWYPGHSLVSKITNKGIKWKDSKCLSAEARLEIVEFIIRNKYEYKIDYHSAQDIDALGINYCNCSIFNEILFKFRKYPIDVVYIDCVHGMENMPMYKDYIKRNKPIKIISKADRYCLSVALASIIAKVTRDMRMCGYGIDYPQYDFGKNKGYGTKLHRNAIKKNGKCKIHRNSFHIKGLD